MRLDQLALATWDAAGVTQLRMGFSRFADIPPARPVAGYGLRTYRPGDEGAWLDTLATGDFGVWDRARLARMLAGDRAPLPPAGVVFATSDDVPIGVANVFLYEHSGGPYSELGWVAVRPEHRSRGLAYELCRRALLFADSLKHRYTYLTTQDFRRAAIKTYLRLGFEPEMTGPDHRARWDELLRTSTAGHLMSQPPAVRIQREPDRK
jgi:mycothiol synthase